MKDYNPQVPVYHLSPVPTDKAVLAERSRAWQGDSFSFGDLLDIINPLQHLPVVSTVYRYLTGDTIGAIPRIIGDGLFGGPIGFVAGLFNASLKKETGKDAGEEVIALLGGGKGGGDAATAVAKGPESGPATPAEATAPATAQAKAAAPTKLAEAPTAAEPPAPKPTAAASVPAVPPAAAKPAEPAAGQAEGVASPITAAAVTPGSGPVNAATRASTESSGIPLARGATPTPPPADPRTTFIERVTAMRRAASRGGPTSRVVPLQGNAAVLADARPRVYRAAAPAAVKPAAAADAAATPKPPFVAPADISQRMMDALAKYTRMQQQRDAAAAAAARGAQVDVAP